MVGLHLAQVRATGEEDDDADEEHLREREQEASERVLKIREDLRRAESLREQLGRDVALCERRTRELGG